MTTVDESAPPAGPVCRPPSRRWRWVALSSLVVLVAGGLVTFLTLRSHYRDAPPLSCACGLVWDAPDSARVYQVRAGPWTADVVPARPGHVQAFEVLIVNPSSVTQTMLGGERGRDTAEPVSVTFARPTGSPLRDQDAKRTKDFTARTAVLPPNGARWVRYAIHTAKSGLWVAGRSESITALDIRVRVGAWTEWQHIGLGNFAFELRDRSR